MLRELLCKQQPDIQFGEISSEVAEFLEAKNAPSWLIEELTQAYTFHHVRIGPFKFSAVTALVQNNTGEPYGIFCDAGYLNLAYGLNGDHIAVELASGDMFFVHHDESWEYFPESGVADPPDVRTRMINPSLGFHRFWERALESDFPRDAYEAEELWPRYVQESGSSDS